MQMATIIKANSKALQVHTKAITEFFLDKRQ